MNFDLAGADEEAWVGLLLCGPAGGGSAKEAVAVIGRAPEAARGRLRTLCQQQDFPYLGLHALRHTEGTRLVRASFQLQDVAEHLRHSDVQTARTYGKWADDRLKEHMRSF